MQSTKAYHHSRGGYYKNWQDKDPSTPRKATGNSSRADNAEDDNDDEDIGDDTPFIAEDGNESDETPLDPALHGISKKGKEKAREQTADDNDADFDQPFHEPVEAQEIQILELHSPRPIISYRGRLFEGKWAEVVGTEAILTQRDSANPLPALRNLAGDIDLLAASSSRILTTEKIPKPRKPEQDNLSAIKEEWNIRIPVGKDKTGEKAEQASFLENLIALKLKRGDKDHVTVYAVDGEGKDWDDRKPLDYRPRRRRPPAQSTKGKQKSDARRSKGRPSMEKRLEKYPVGFGHAVSSPKGLSTPTPQQWEDLSEQDDHDDGDDGINDENDEDEDSEEDIMMTA